MLFNSYLFLCAFLPLALSGFFVSCRLGSGVARGWLIAMSLLFYGWWVPAFTILLLGSICFNYAISRGVGASARQPGIQKAVLAFGIASNILLLGYYKYFAALVRFFAHAGIVQLHVPTIALPLGISFFTFTQIAYLIDVQQGEAKNRGFLDYVLFVTFFPHLIAGPILHNREIMPQFADRSTYRISTRNLAIGLMVFVIGLAKKCIFADSLAPLVSAGFGATGHLGVFASWAVLMSYSLQLYFDFSGYSDMAIGLAYMFNVRFPLNFNSPFKAASIIDYWQRWHMTLTRYLTLYLYNPIALAVVRIRARRGLGITRQAQATAGGFAGMIALPTIVTMGLAGIWHGAGLQYLIFGLLHGTYLTVNHAWRLVRGRSGVKRPSSVVSHVAGVALTYVSVLLALDFFRAPSVGAALSLVGGLSGHHGFEGVMLPDVLLSHLPLAHALLQHGIVTGAESSEFLAAFVRLAWLVLLFWVVWMMPNTQQIMGRLAPVIDQIKLSPSRLLVWQPTPLWACATGLVATIAVLAIGGTTEFLYFQF